MWPASAIKASDPPHQPTVNSTAGEAQRDQQRPAQRAAGTVVVRMVVVFVHEHSESCGLPILRIGNDVPAARLPFMSIEFQLRRNRRARRVTLRVKPDSSLVVTAPPRVPKQVIHDFLAERAEWIEMARKRMDAARAERADHLNATHPERIALPAIGHELRILYRNGGRLRWRALARDAIELQGSDEPDDAKTLLVDVLKQFGRTDLEPRVRDLADRHGLNPGRITWRNQKSRWGSCSSNGNLSLNVRLLLLDRPVCDYVLLHELAHLEHPNHSRAFWARVETMCPDYRLRERELRAASRTMPVWITG
jgi:predicted metal-dependent hydrolase